MIAIHGLFEGFIQSCNDYKQGFIEVVGFNKDTGHYLLRLNPKGVAHLINKKMSIIEKLMALKTKFSEMLDTYKDLIYLFAFRHVIGFLFILIHSIVYPFALFHVSQFGRTTFSITHSLMVHFHLSSNSIERQTRKQGATVFVALWENLPQFFVQMREILKFRNSVNFIQAGLPIFTYIMSMSTLAPVLGFYLFQALIFRKSKEKYKY